MRGSSSLYVSQHRCQSSSFTTKAPSLTLITPSHHRISRAKPQSSPGATHTEMWLQAVTSPLFLPLAFRSSRIRKKLSSPCVSTLLNPYRNALQSTPVKPMMAVDPRRHSGPGASGSDEAGGDMAGALSWVGPLYSGKTSVFEHCLSWRVTSLDV